MSLGLADGGTVTAVPSPEPVFTLPTAASLAPPDKLETAHLSAIKVPESREKRNEKCRLARADKAA